MLDVQASAEDADGPPLAQRAFMGFRTGHRFIMRRTLVFRVYDMSMAAAPENLVGFDHEDALPCWPPLVVPDGASRYMSVTLMPALHPSTLRVGVKGFQGSCCMSVAPRPLLGQLAVPLTRANPEDYDFPPREVITPKPVNPRPAP